MSKTNSLSLPYYFRNIGTQSATMENLRTAAPLKAEITLCPPDTIVKAHFQPHGQERVDSVTEWKNLPSEVERALTGQYKELVLWSVVIHSRNIHFQFRDATQCTVGKHAIDGSIIMENCGYLTLELQAQPFKTLEPERVLCCQFGDDAAWGNFVDLTEWRAGYGIRKFVVYPEAESRHFEKISRH